VTIRGTELVLSESWQSLACDGPDLRTAPGYVDNADGCDQDRVRRRIAQQLGELAL
jgi:hypothetical protein